MYFNNFIDKSLQSQEDLAGNTLIVFVLMNINGQY